MKIKNIQSRFNEIKRDPFLLESLKTMFLRITGVIIIFGFSLFLTRHYKPEIIGQYDFIRMVLLVLGSICILGTDQSIMYFTGVLKNSNNYQELKNVYIKMLLLITGMSLIVLLVFLLVGKNRIAFFLNDAQVYYTLLKAILILVFYAVTLFNTEVFRALESVYIAELFRNTFKYISIILGSIILLFIHKETYLVECFLIGFVFLSLISTIMVFRIFSLKITHSQSTVFSYSHILKRSYPIAISTMAIFLLSTLDIIFLKKYYGDKVVAQYGVGVKIMTIIAMIIQMINSNVATKVANLFYGNKKTELKNTIQKSVRIQFLFMLPCIFFIVLFSKKIVALFGPEYLIVEKTMLILVFGQGMVSLCGIAPTYLNMTGRQQIFKLILLFAVGINFILNVYLIPQYGMEGAAWSFVGSMVFWNIVVIIIAFKKDHIKIFLH